MPLDIFRQFSSYVGSKFDDKVCILTVNIFYLLCIVLTQRLGASLCLSHQLFKYMGPFRHNAFNNGRGKERTGEER